MPKTVGDKMNRTDLQKLIHEAIAEQTSSTSNGDVITRSELKEVIKQTIRSILNEMGSGFQVQKRNVAEEKIDAEELQSIWEDDKNGEYIAVLPDENRAYYVAHGKKIEEIPPGRHNIWMGIRTWMDSQEFYPNIWSANKRGNLTLWNHRGEELGGLVEQLHEMTTTGDVAPLNLPMSAKGTVASRGGSARGVAGSRSLGYELTPIGKQDMARKQDSVYEQ
jgi:hypothetical protein